MIRRRGPGRTLALAAWSALTLAAHASSRAETPVPASAAVCQGCHGVHGEGNAPAAIPRLAGQSAEYLREQLEDYASGKRTNPVMQNFAKPLTPTDIEALAAYFSSAHAPRSVNPSTASEAQLDLGRRLAQQGSEVKRVQACNSCHGPDGMGVLHAAPYLAGQSAGYLTSALTAFHEGARQDDPGKLMSSVAGQLDAADIAAAAGYFASLPGADAPAASAATAPVRTILERHDQTGVARKEIVLGTALLPAGSFIGFHTHPGDEVGYVLKGPLVLKKKGEPDRILKTGDTFFNERGVVHSLGTEPGSEGGTAVSTWIIDKGAPLATPVPN